MKLLASRVQNVGPSVFAEINALARAHGAINLSQGAPDFDGPPEVIGAAVAALQSGLTTQYAPSTGTEALRQGIAEHARRFYGHQVDPDQGVLVLGGASLAVYFAITGLIDPGDEVVLFEPFFDTYVPNIEMAGGVARFVPLRPPDWAFDPAELAAAFTPRTRAILLNTPHNPTGKVFSREELAEIARLCQQWDVLAICDEVYEHLLYDGATHVRLATLPGMAERTITISSAGKTFSATGFKIGWAMGTAALLDGMKRLHEFSMYAVAHPLQQAVAEALRLPQSYFDGLNAFYQPRRDMLAEMLRAAGLKPALPDRLGAFYLMADFSDIFEGDDFEFARHLIRDVGVACIPATPFFSAGSRALGQRLARFTFCKKMETLQAAQARLAPR